MRTLFPSSGGFSRPRRLMYDEEDNVPLTEADGLSTLDKIKLQLAAFDKYNQQENQINPNRMNVIYKEPPVSSRITPYQQENINLRDRALDISQARLEGSMNLGRERNMLSAERNQIASDRAKVYEFKAKNPNLRFDFSGPTVKVAHPVTGQITDTGIATGNLSDEDRINLTQENAIERLNLSNTFREALAEIMHGYRMEEIGERGKEARETKATVPGRADVSTSASQVRTARYNAAKELVDTQPELGQFITLGPGGTFAITATKAGRFGMKGSGPTDEQRKKINEFIYKKSTELPKNDDTNKDKNNEEVIVEKDGKRYKLPKNELAEAIKQGYKEVK